MNCGHDHDELPENAIWHTTAFISKSLLSTEWHYINIESEFLCLLYVLETFTHYCFAREVCVITDHKPLVAIVCKDVATFSQRLQQIMLCIHQYRVHIIYKPYQDLCITGWLSWNNHREDKDKTTGMNINVNTISTAVNMPVCTFIEDIWLARCKDSHLQKLKPYIIHGWPHKKDKLEHSIRNL